MTTQARPGDMTADQLISLFNNERRHPNALRTELMMCRHEVLVTLAYGEFEDPQVIAPCDLAEMAYNELDRRHAAKGALFAPMGCH